MKPFRISTTRRCGSTDLRTIFVLFLMLACVGAGVGIFYLCEKYQKQDKELIPIPNPDPNPDPIPPLPGPEPNPGPEPSILGPERGEVGSLSVFSVENATDCDWKVVSINQLQPGFYVDSNGLTLVYAGSQPDRLIIIAAVKMNDRAVVLNHAFDYHVKKDDDDDDDDDDKIVPDFTKDIQAAVKDLDKNQKQALADAFLKTTELIRSGYLNQAHSIRLQARTLLSKAAGPDGQRSEKMEKSIEKMGSVIDSAMGEDKDSVERIRELYDKTAKILQGG